jgi:hypothetical protein
MTHSPSLTDRETSRPFVIVPPASLADPRTDMSFFMKILNVYADIDAYETLSHGNIVGKRNTFCMFLQI